MEKATRFSKATRVEVGMTGIIGQVKAGSIIRERGRSLEVYTVAITDDPHKALHGSTEETFYGSSLVTAG